MQRGIPMMDRTKIICKGQDLDFRKRIMYSVATDLLLSVNSHVKYTRYFFHYLPTAIIVKDPIPVLVKHIILVPETVVAPIFHAAADTSGLYVLLSCIESRKPTMYALLPKLIGNVMSL